MLGSGDVPLAPFSGLWRPAFAPPRPKSLAPVASPTRRKTMLPGLETKTSRNARGRGARRPHIFPYYQIARAPILGPGQDILSAPQGTKPVAGPTLGATLHPPGAPKQGNQDFRIEFRYLSWSHSCFQVGAPKRFYHGRNHFELLKGRTVLPSMHRRLLPDSLVGQDRWFSPTRPGFDSRLGNFWCP